MISVFRAPDKTTGKLLPVVIITLSATDLITTAEGSVVPAVGLDVGAARKVGREILRLAEVIDREQG